MHSLFPANHRNPYPVRHPVFFPVCPVRYVYQPHKGLPVFSIPVLLCSFLRCYARQTCSGWMLIPLWCHPHEVNILLQGLFYFAAGIDIVQVSIKQHLEHHTGMVAAGASSFIILFTEINNGKRGYLTLDSPLIWELSLVNIFYSHIVSTSSFP